MRTSPTFLFVAGLWLAGCADPVEPDPGFGTTGVLVRTTTTGLDLDPDGYRLVVDGADRGGAQRNDTVAVTPLDPGTHTVALTGVHPNCSITGDASQTVDLARGRVVETKFAVVCTAKTGVLAVLVTHSGEDQPSVYHLSLGQFGNYSVPAGQRTYLVVTSGGSQTASVIAPANCSVDENAKTVTISVGGLVRDTAEVAFAVVCERLRATLRITTRTAGVVPHPDGIDPYHVDLVYAATYDYYRVNLGHVDPNGILEVEVYPDDYYLELVHVPGGCAVLSRNPTETFTPPHRAELEFEFEVQCPS